HDALPIFPGRPRDADSYTPDRLLQPADIIGHRAVHRRRIFGIVPGNGAEQQRAIVRAAGERPAMIKRVAIGKDTVLADTTERGLETDHAAQRRRNSYRSAVIAPNTAEVQGGGHTR